MSSDKYFASLPKDEIGTELMRKVNEWYTHVSASGIFNKMKKSYYFYYGYSEKTGSSTSDVISSGEQGELSLVRVNHYRNLIQHIKVMTTSSRPAMEARAINTDHRSLAQTILANSILDYYLREKRLEEHLNNAVEYSLIFGEGYVSLEWDTSMGEEYTVDPDTGKIVHTGDLRFTSLHPLDVVKDIYEPDGQDSNWRIVRKFRNKFDLAAKYPEIEDEILSSATSNNKEINALFQFTTTYSDNNDLIPVFEFYHRKSESLPEGRMVAFVDNDVILYDGPLPYKSIPVYRMSPGNFIGTTSGYTPGFDLLGLQEVLDALYSSVVTNQTTFGVQNVLVPSGHNISVSQLAGGMNIIEYDSQHGKPESMNLTSTPPEIFNFIDKIEKAMETISGVNQVARGDPAANLRSGNALALIQSMAIQFNSGLQNSYARLIEEIGTSIINTLKEFAEAPRLIQITGRNTMSYMKEFRGSDLDRVNRVVVDIANPLSKTMAGKVEIADNLLQMNLVNPQQYINLIKTGNLDVMLEAQEAELMLIKDENESLSDGNYTPVIVTDAHALHIQEHKTVLATVEARKNPEIIQATNEHIQEHIDALKNTDPGLLTVLGQQPIQQGPQGGGAPGAPIEALMGAGQGGQAPAPQEGIPGVLENSVQLGEELPGEASMPTNPLTGEKFDPNA